MLVFSQLTFAQGRLLFIWQVSDDYCSLNQLSQHYVKSQLELLTSGIIFYILQNISFKMSSKTYTFLNKFLYVMIFNFSRIR